MRRIVRRLALLLCLAAGVVAAAPAHYVVFTRDARGSVQPVFYARVDLADGRDDGRAPAIGASGGERVAWRAWKAGSDLGERSVAIPELRGEFARDPDRGEGAIVAHRPHAAERSFVLRIPLGEIDAVEFGGSGIAQRFDFAELAARAGELRLASRASQAQVERVQGGSAANRVDMLVVGDGYTTAQQSLFDSDAAILHDAFFGLTPYRDYQSFVNWTTAFVASNQSGADHPPYQSGCSQANCCADTSAMGDPHAGQFVDTAFDATFCAFQIQRLLVVDDAAVFAAAAAYPEWDKIVVVVNDDTYGGSGGGLSVTSTHAQAPQIVLHEYGHSFTGLADEYHSPYPGFPPCSDTGGTPCEANVTNQIIAAQVKWNSWFTPGNPIPTPSGTSGVGLFEGARYELSGMYRPVDTQCLMQFLGVPFCPVCRQEYVRTLYRGGWGAPAAGIDLIEPGSETPATATPVPYTPGASQAFGVSLLRPTIGSVGVQWYLDGNPIGGATSANYTFSQAGSTPASHTLQVRAKDLTSFVSAAMAGGLLDYQRSWSIQVGGDVIFRNGFDGS